MGDDAPLRGVTIGVTGARKGPELCAALERRGATTLHGPTIEPDQPAPDEELLPQLKELLHGAPDWFVANTGTGVRLLADVADRHGQGGDLRALLGSEAVRVVARGAKAVGGLHGVGVRAEHVADAETDASMAAWLREQVTAGEHLAVQYSGRTRSDYADLTELGVTVQVLRPYRTGTPTDDGPARLLVEAAIGGELDVVVCTSAIATDNLVRIAEAHGLRHQLLAALGERTVAAAIGQVTADAFRAHGVEPGIIPDRHRTGALLDAIAAWAA